MQPINNSGIGFRSISSKPNTNDTHKYIAYRQQNAIQQWLIFIFVKFLTYPNQNTVVGYQGQQGFVCFSKKLIIKNKLMNKQIFNIHYVFSVKLYYFASKSVVFFASNLSIGWSASLHICG